MLSGSVADLYRSWEGFAVLGARVRNVAVDVSVALEVGASL